MTARDQPPIRRSKRTSDLRLPTRVAIGRARDEACRQDFVSFNEIAFDLLSHGKPLLKNWHIEALAYHLDQVRLGKIKRLIINLPPRSLKSHVTSVAFPAFVLGHDPTKHVIVVSYGSDLAVKLANDFRTLVCSSRYKSIFPDMRISRTKNTEFEIATTLGGSRLATSIDGAVTGRGADIIIIDDSLKPSDAASDAKREHVNQWYGNTLLPRLDDKQKGAISVDSFKVAAKIGWSLTFPLLPAAMKRYHLAMVDFITAGVGMCFMRSGNRGPS